MKQQSFSLLKPSLTFGGSLMKGRRKVARPLCTKRPIHLVLKASVPTVLLRNQHHINRITKRMGQRFGVKIFKLAVHADHVHLVIQIHSRRLYNRWIRAVCSLLVAAMPGLKFSLRPFTTIVSWGRHFQSVLDYLQRNQDEGDFMYASFTRMEDWLAQKLREFGLAPQL